MTILQLAAVLKRVILISVTYKRGVWLYAFKKEAR
jgi:hypothetical protein